MGSLAFTGRILTGNGQAKAILISDGLVEAVGGDEVNRMAQERGIPVEDLGSGAILPGFVDPHVHLDLYAVALKTSADCRFPRCKSVADVLDSLSDHLKNGLRENGWLIGYGNLFFDQKLADRRLPTVDELDSVSRDVPIQLKCGGHASVLNTRGLEEAGVAQWVGGGVHGLWGAPVIDVDQYGRPTGTVSEVDQLIPVPELSDQERQTALADAYATLFSRYGVTTFGEMAGSHRSVAALDSVIASGDLPGRSVIHAMVPAAVSLADGIEWAAQFRSSSGPDRLSMYGLKLFVDGGYSSRNAATRQPYVREHSPYPGYRGRLNMTQSTISATITAARAAGIRLAFHANGQRAQDEIIQSILDLGAAHEFAPTRIEHAGNLVNDSADYQRFRRANIRPVVQPGFLYNFMADFVPIIVGDQGSTGRLPLRAMLDDGVVPAASSDVGMGAEDEQSNPLFSIWECMARRSYWGREIDPEMALGFLEALQLHTIEGARALGIDDRVGSLEPGKIADLVIVDRDPLLCSLDEIRNIKVTAVLLDGTSTGAGQDAA